MRDAWPALVVLGGVVIALLVGYFWPRQSAATAFAVAGVVLQWAGLAVVAVGMVQMRQRFKRPSWFTRFWRAVQRPRDVTVRVASGTGGIALGASATASGTSAPRTLEERLAELEKSMAKLRQDVNTRADALGKEIGTVRSALHTETAARKAAIRDILAQLEEVSAGGLRLEAIGLWWLLFGVLFTSVPNELATVVGPF